MPHPPDGSHSSQASAFDSDIFLDHRETEKCGNILDSVSVITKGGNPVHTEFFRVGATEQFLGVN